MTNSHGLLLRLLDGGKLPSLTSLAPLHALLTTSSLIHHPILLGKLLLAACDRSLPYAERLFLSSPRPPDAFMYNTLMRAFSESHSPERSFLYFNHLLRQGPTFPVDSFSLAFAAKAAANLRCLWSGFQVHCQAVTRGLYAHLFVGTTLVSMYGECREVGLAWKVFDEMPIRNAVSWNAIINGCFRCGHIELALGLFRDMPSKDSTSYNVLLAGYMKEGDLEQAKVVFHEMPSKDDVSWSTMITGFTQNGCFGEALGFFRDMLLAGARLTEESLTGILSACADVGNFELGRVLHGLLEKRGLTRITSVNNALLDTYSKCGDMGMAQLVFKRMYEMRNLVSWSTMIAGLSMQGHCEEAIKHFEEMQKSGIYPDGITFISVLYACSHSGFVKDGNRYFSEMMDKHGIEPAIEHYGCMVDLYSRAGELNKAYDFISRMPIPPTSVIWRTLLGACSFHGDVKLAEKVKERLSEIDPENSGDHVLLSNTYAVAEKWKDVAAVRRSMVDQKIKKIPGWSMIEVDKTMYHFVAGENLNEIAEEAYEKLSEITSRLRIEAGYVPEVDKTVLHDIEEEEKEDSVMRHSEKLAVAFGIARLHRGSNVRVVKNLRICRDCHTFMKMVSRVYAMEVVVRDRSRFHTFRQGSCSCRDYW
ncbi:hypothetical protein MLD38_026632 [Melastoma candidum]|uniref:Uncharacterized protein n=1 Tax=Melastoma candidum TaxID=119954 RepID=A0ACB9NZ63_9MYRT|nr:hypothetical protein MLD38_026632 [Melastoma candidum]